MDNPETFTTSANNNQCISKCIKKDSNVVNPYTNGFVHTNEYDFCIIPQYYSSGKRAQHYDKCIDGVKSYNADIVNRKPSQFEINPFYFFNSNNILKYSYGINSYDKFIENLKQDKLITTKMRILDYGWVVYKEDFVVQNILVDVVIGIINEIWIYDIIKIIKNLDDKIGTNKFNNDNIEEYIKINLINNSSIAKILEKFVVNDNINYFTHEFKIYYYDLITKNIDKYLKNIASKKLL